MIAWFVATASAQENAWLVGSCDIFQPVAGTAGFTNAIDAIRTNATTYSAGEFARRRLRDDNYLVMDFHIVVGAAKVPTWCTGTGEGGSRSGEMYFQPLDLGATNLGVVLPAFRDGPLNSSFEVFYASAVTQSLMGSRAVSWVLPLFNLYPALAAPAVGNYRDGRGLFTYAVDWIGGASFQSDAVSVQAGYTGSQGLYFDVTQRKIALFANGVFADGVQWSDASYALAGVQQFDPLAVGLDQRAVGMTSLYYRDIPSGGVLEEVVDGARTRVAERLRTGHLRQEDIASLLDVRTSYEFGERFRVRELAAGIHTEGWHQRADDDVDGDLEAVSLRAGVVNLPPQPLLGLKGGVRPTIVGDFAYRESGAVLGVRGSIRMNDPDLLDLYPFAYNALGVNFELTGVIE